MRILVACEESQAVTIEMRKLGHEAYSCDIIECSGGHPEWHIKGDALQVINGRCVFQTMDGKQHEINSRWDILIAHPPCTFLTAASAVRLFNRDGTIKDQKRYEKGEEAAKFFLQFWKADCERVAVENPTPLRAFGLPEYSQSIEPWWFGDPWKKRTCLWLRGLPPLMPTDVVVPRGLWVGATCAKRDPTLKQKYQLHSNRDKKRRSKTFPGIAKAMAEQWAGPADNNA